MYLINRICVIGGARHQLRQSLILQLYTCFSSSFASSPPVPSINREADKEIGSAVSVWNELKNKKLLKAEAVANTSPIRLNNLRRALKGFGRIQS